MIFLLRSFRGDSFLKLQWEGCLEELLLTQNSNWAGSTKNRCQEKEMIEEYSQS